MSRIPDSRRLACEFIVAAAVCGGAYYFVASTAHSKIGAVRADIAKLQSEEAARAGLGALTDTQVSDLRRTTAERAADMRAKSLPASDEAIMFARISELAAAHSVRIESLNPAQSQPTARPVTLPPGVQPGTPAAAAQGAVADAVPAAKDTRIGYNMFITGRYSDIAGFLGSLSDRLGYTMIKSVRISQPDIRQADTLRAAIETEHIALDLAGVTVSSAPATVQPMPLAPDSTTAHAADHE